MRMVGQPQSPTSSFAGMTPGGKPLFPQDLRGLVRPVLVVLPASGLCLGLLARLGGFDDWSGPVWAAATIPVLLALVIEIVGQPATRRGRP